VITGSTSIFYVTLFRISLRNVPLKADRDGVIVVATRYGLDGPGVEFRGMARFSATVQTGPGDHPTSYTIRTGGKAGGEWRGQGKSRAIPLRHILDFAACSRL